MRQNIIKTATSLFVTTALVVTSISIPVRAASDNQTGDALSQFSVITREYDTSNDGLVRYQYINEDGEVVSFGDSSSSEKGTLTAKKAASIPSSYDLRNSSAVTSIKDQGVTGSCWAFATIKSIESNQIMQTKQSADSIDLSENHLCWYTYHPSETASDLLYKEGLSISGSENTTAYNYGGSSVLAAFTLARWSGAVKEATAPFTASTTKELTSMANTMENKKDSLRYEADYKLTDAVCYDTATRDQIKTAIMENGAMSVAFYYDTFFDHKTSSNDIAYYQKFLTGEKAIYEANHCVTIIGWDDTYSRNNFGIYKPSSDGAWLIANSYGTDYGNGGYFWLSYEEPSLNEYYSFITTSSDTYDNNYQYDGFGWNNAIYNSNSNTIQAANIFTANAGYQQSLKAVGMYTVTDNQPYTIKIYRNVTAGQPTSGKLAATVSGTQDYQGYHTVTLPDAVSLDAGERFSVVLSYERTNDNNGYLPLEGASSRDISCILNYTSHSGESYLYTQYDESDSTEWYWLDLGLYGQSGIQNNVCIKAFTTNETPVGTISFEKSKISLGKGETCTTKPTVKEITDKTLTWKSSNKTVATVNSKGKVTAKAQGTAKITATLLSGKSASYTVTVKKAPVKITATPVKKTLKPKKSFQIKTKLPSGSASNKITYSSSKPSVAKVNSSGTVTGVKKGTAIITVSTYNKKKAKITVTVKG